MRKKVLLIGLLISPFLVFAQESQVLNLNIQQAQEYALEHNKTLKNSKVDVDIAKKQLWQAISQGLPQVSGTVDYTNYFNYSMEFSMGGDSEVPDISGIPGIDAGDVILFNMLMESLTGGSGTAIKMKHTSNATLQVSQLIFSGQYIAGIQLSKINQILVDMSLEKSEIDILESVTNTYYMSLITDKSMEIIDANIENLDQTLKQTQALLNAGMIEETDVDQIKMSITMLENSKRSLQRNAELNNNLMKFQLGLDNDVELILSENYDGVFNSINFMNILNVEFNPNENIDMRLLSTQEELSHKMLAMERWTYAPTLAGAYNHTEKLLTTGFDMNPKNLFTFNLSIPILSSGQRKANVEQKKLELIKVQNSKEIVNDQLLMQEKQLRFNLTSALEGYQSQKANVDLARKIYNNTELKFRQGVASSFDLIQANSNLLQAENNYISSGMELLQAKLAFDKLFNKI
ncbi:MAG: TolC family protein [Bacteroidales bacterium]|jgi:outer membrane protein TolC|nr:TolC family protein [Bacteroidales bacterium]